MQDQSMTPSQDDAMKPMPTTEEEWKQTLTAEQYDVLRQAGTERAFTGKYYDHHDDGMYRCAGCNAPLFASDTKFDSGTGWPSFTDPVNNEHVTLIEDMSHGMRRVEVRCKQCDGHLGHVFPDGPQGKNRFCINSCSLNFEKK
jgi:peptide-methionine (R)-S-oxide reductase